MVVMGAGDYVGCEVVAGDSHGRLVQPKELIGHLVYAFRAAVILLT